MKIYQPDAGVLIAASSNLTLMYQLATADAVLSADWVARRWCIDSREQQPGTGVSIGRCRSCTERRLGRPKLIYR